MSQTKNETRNAQYAQTLAKMISCKTISNLNETDKTCFYSFHDTMKSLFPHIFSVCKTEDFNGSLLMKWEGTSDSSQVLFMNHFDVVVPTGEWKHNPFGAEIEDGRLWGRGTIDDKSGVFGMLQAADELAEKGFVPKNTIYFETGCDEEINGENCLTIAKALKERGIKFDWILDEGGMITDDPISGAKGRFAMVGVGEKACVDIKFTANSAGGHASTPSKNDSLLRLAKFMNECSKKKIFDVYMSPTVCRMFKVVSKKMSGPLKMLMGHPVLFKPLLQKVMSTIPVANAFLTTTVAFTRAEGSNANNVLPAKAWVIANMRVSHHQGIKDSVDKISALAKKYDLEIEILDPGFPSNLSSYETKGFKLIEQAVAHSRDDVDATVPYIMTGASDSRFMSIVSDNCYRFVPFLADAKQISTVHGIDENINIDTLASGVDFYKYMMENL